MNGSIRELLERSPFLEGLDRRDLAELAGSATMRAVGPGERVFAEGKPATALFLLVSGAVVLSFSASVGGGGIAVQTVIHEGQPIGWSALVERWRPGSGVNGSGRRLLGEAMRRP